MQHLIDELQAIIDRGSRMPFGDKLVLDGAAVRDLIEEMRRVIPDEARLGQRIASERDRILADARAQARRILDDAQAQVDKRLEDHAILQAARRRAQEIEAGGQQRADKLVADADVYVAGQLRTLEARLHRILREVQAGQIALQPPAKEKPSTQPDPAA